jgi:bleomycin hydrolase
MPETKQSSATGRINRLVAHRLRGYAAELRGMHGNGADLTQLRQRKEEMLSQIYGMLVLAYGKPPTEFEFRYQPDDSTAKPEATTYTPQSFKKEYIGETIPDYVVLMDNPNHPYDRPYKGEWSRNMYERDDITMLNLPVSRLKHYCMKAVLDSQVVWFACDVGKEHCSDSAVFATDVYDYDEIFDTKFRLTKAERLGYGDGWATHAMVLMGVDTASDGRPIKWLVENSWGTKRGDDGFWYMYDDWFDEYIYVVVVEKSYLDEDDLRKLELEPAVTPMWDVLFRSLRNLE